MSYTETIQGVPVTSNQPFNQALPKGSKYTVDIRWSIPVSYLLQYGYDISLIFDIQAMASAIASQQGSDVSLSDFSLSSPDAYTTEITFIASSPAPLIVILAIFGVAAVIVYLISTVTITVVKALGPAIPILGIAVGAMIITGLGIFGYSFVKSKEFRAETVRGATGAVRYTRETIAPAVTKGAQAAAGYAGRGASYLKASYLRPSPESEEP